MWILLVTLDNGLVDAKHFGPHTKTAFWVGVCLCVVYMFTACHSCTVPLIFQVLALVVMVVGFTASLPFQIFIREKPNISLKKLKWQKWLENPHFYLVIS